MLKNSCQNNTLSSQYDYDAVGNRNGETINGNSTSYTIAENGNRLLANNGTAYSYDNNGNLLQSGALNYHYDSINRPDIVSDGSGVIAKYGYNPLSQRVIKEINGKKTIYIYDETGELLSEIDVNSGQTIRNYVWLDGEPIAILEGSNIYYIHDDHNGTPLMVTDKKGAIVWQANYDAFGKASITTEKITLNLRFAGQYYDDETKLHYNWHRYYDPSIGRYISSDPLGLAAGVNTYIYVNGNPINFTDPQGLMTYQCTKPLHSFNGAGWVNNNVIYKVPPFHHQYSCVVRNGNITCGGQDRADDASVGNTILGKNVPSKPSVDNINPDGGKCQITQPDNDCFEQCMINQWSEVRPKYNLFNRAGGVNCQQYDNNVNSLCKSKCGL